MAAESPRAPELFIRVFKKLRMLATVTPIQLDIAKSALLRTTYRVLNGRSRKLAVTFLASAALLIALGSYWVAALFLAPGIWILASRGVRRVREELQLRSIATNGPGDLEIPSAEQTLRRMGLDTLLVDQMLSKESEFAICEFDQDNRVLSEAGRIPIFDGHQIERDAFKPRRRNRVQVVVLPEAVAIKKTYASRSGLRNEALVLHALRHVKEVPKIIRVSPGDRVLYQSFVPGQSVGTLMGEFGAPVSVQYRADVHFSTRSREESSASKESALAIEAFHAVVNEEFRQRLVDLFERVGNAGVALRDVKYGNVLVQGGAPYLVDFDGASVFPKRSYRLLLERQKDRDRYNHGFGEAFLSEDAFQRELQGIIASTGALYAPMYYGHGFKVGDVNSVELGTGKWLLIRTYLPDVRGMRIVDLGSNHGVLPLEMLKAGATSVVGFELSPEMTRLARLNHRWFEFVQNRTYDLEIIEDRMSAVCDLESPDFDIATAFCSLYYEPPDVMTEIVRTLSRCVKYFVVQANENPDQHSGELLERSSLPFLQDRLANNGFPTQRVVRFRYYDRPLVIAAP